MAYRNLEKAYERVDTGPYGKMLRTCVVYGKLLNAEEFLSEQ